MRLALLLLGWLLVVSPIVAIGVALYVFDGWRGVVVVFGGTALIIGLVIGGFALIETYS